MVTRWSVFFIKQFLEAEPSESRPGCEHQTSTKYEASAMMIKTLISRAPVSLGFVSTSPINRRDGFLTNLTFLLEPHR